MHRSTSLNNRPSGPNVLSPRAALPTANTASYRLGIASAMHAPNHRIRSSNSAVEEGAIQAILLSVPVSAGPILSGMGRLP
jgi:hypothetical protein